MPDQGRSKRRERAEKLVFAVRPGLEIRHFDKNSNSRKCKTQGKTQNSRGKIPKLKEKTQGFGKFYSQKAENNKINVKMSFKGKFMLVFEFFKKCDFDGDLVKTHAIPQKIVRNRTKPQNLNPKTHGGGKSICSICRLLVEFLSLI